MSGIEFFESVGNIYMIKPNLSETRTFIEETCKYFFELFHFEAYSLYMATVIAYIENSNMGLVKATINSIRRNKRFQI